MCVDSCKTFRHMSIERHFRSLRQVSRNLPYLPVHVPDVLLQIKYVLLWFNAFSSVLFTAFLPKVVSGVGVPRQHAVPFRCQLD